MKNVKLLTISFALILAMLGSPLVALAEFDGTFENIDYGRGKDIRVILEGMQLDFDVPPQVVDGRVLVPMRKMFESFGLTVTWDDSLRAAIGKSSTMDIMFPIGSKKVTVNGSEYNLDVPAQIIGGSTMVPLRFLSENMAYNVVWNGESRLILLSKYPVVEWKYEYFEATKPYKEYERKFVNGVSTEEFRHTGKNHDVAFLNLYKKDGSLVKNVPDFKVKDYPGWSQKSSFGDKTYWVHIDELAKGLKINPIYLESDYQPLKLVDIKETAEVGNYVKVKISEQYFDLQDWKNVIGTPSSNLNSIMDGTTLDEKAIEASDTLFKIEINDKYNTVVAFNTLNGPVFNSDSGKVYTVLEKSPTTLFNWDSKTWSRLEEKIPWTGMTQDMLLVQFKMKPDKTTKINTKFNNLELWVYTEDYGDLIYYFKDEVLTNIL